MRYAAYFVPRDETVLGRLGTAWMDGLGGRIADSLLAGPRHYLFHATLKAPFALAAGFQPDEIVAASRDAAQLHGPVPLNGLEIVWFGPYAMLVPRGDPSQINALAFDCVATLDPMRAPMTERDRNSRIEGRRLTQNQIAALDRWGYPFVGSEFRFHLTLAGPVPAEDRAEIEAIAADHFQDALPDVHLVDDIAVTVETSKDAPMSVLSRVDLADAGSESVA